MKQDTNVNTNTDNIIVTINGTDYNKSSDLIASIHLAMNLYSHSNVSAVIEVKKNDTTVVKLER